MPENYGPVFREVLEESYRQKYGESRCIIYLLKVVFKTKSNKIYIQINSMKIVLTSQPKYAIFKYKSDPSRSAMCFLKETRKPRVLKKYRVVRKILQANRVSPYGFSGHERVKG